MGLPPHKGEEFEVLQDRINASALFLVTAAEGMNVKKI